MFSKIKVFFQKKSKPTPIYSSENKEIFFNFLNNIDTIYSNHIKQGLEFEKFIVAIYQMAGYTAYITDKKNDKGIDVIVELNSKEKICIQCKNYSLKAKGVKTVKQKDVLKFNGVNTIHKKILITTSFFQGTFNFNDFPNITFIDRKGLFQLINDLVPDLLQEYLFLESLKIGKIHSCPECQTGYILRIYNEKGAGFRGCTNYPTCKHTEYL